MRKIVFLMALLSSLAFANSELERQCNNGNARSCNNLGYLYEYGNGIRQDYKKAREFYNKACEMGNALGCGALGGLYQYGLGVRQNYKKENRFSTINSKHKFRRKKHSGKSLLEYL